MARRTAYRLLLAAFATYFSFAAAPARAEDTAARDLVKRVLDSLPKDPLQAKLQLTVQGEPARELDLSHKFVEGARASYLEVTAPPDLAGIRFLFRQPVDGPNEQYIKVTASRTVVEVSEEIRKQPFLGSTFYVSDLVEPKIGDFTYSFVGEEELLGRKCKLVEARPKNPKDELYSKTILSLDPTDLLILKRQFFDPEGNLLKVWTIEKVEKVDGIWSLMKQKMDNVQEKASSNLDVVSIKYGVDLKEMMFTPKYLLR